MKRFLCIAATAIFAASIIGCHADVEPNDHANDKDYSMKKTTKIDENGNKTTHYEEHTNP